MGRIASVIYLMTPQNQLNESLSIGLRVADELMVVAMTSDRSGGEDDNLLFPLQIAHFDLCVSANSSEFLF